MTRHLSFLSNYSSKKQMKNKFPFCFNSFVENDQRESTTICYMGTKCIGKSQRVCNKKLIPEQRGGIGTGLLINFMSTLKPKSKPHVSIKKVSTGSERVYHL